MFAAFLTTILFSLSAVSAYRTTRVLGGIEANFWRMLLATALLGLWAHTFGQGLGGGAMGYFLLSGFIGFGLGDLALYQALPRIGSRLSILLVQCLAAPFAAISEWLWLGYRLTAMEIGCASIILFGVFLALAPGRHLNVTRRALVIGLIFGIIAAFGQGFGAVLSRKAYDAASAPIDGLTAAYQRILAGLVVAVISLVFLKARSSPPNGESTSRAERLRKVWPWIALNGVAGPALGVGCYQWALSTTPTGIVLPIVAITPLIVIPMARFTEGERATRKAWIGGIIAVAGAAALAYFSNRPVSPASLELDNTPGPSASLQWKGLS